MHLFIFLLLHKDGDYFYCLVDFLFAFRPFFVFGGIMDFIVTLFFISSFIFILSGPRRNVGDLFSLASEGLFFFPRAKIIIR